MSMNKRQKRNKYAKIPKKHKILFLKRVIQQKQPLKTVADFYKINYSTAKTFLRQYRSDLISLDMSECSNTQTDHILSIENSQSTKRCCFKMKEEKNNSYDLNCHQKSIPNIEQQNSKINLSFQPINYIIQWPKIEQKSNRIQIISKTLFQ